MLGRNGDKNLRFDSDAFEKGPKLFFNVDEPVLRVILQIHLVDEHRDLPNAEEV